MTTTQNSKNTSAASHSAAAFIKKQKPGFTPKMAIILGSGLGKVAEKISNATIIPYEKIPDFPKCRVAGHDGQLFLGELHNMPVICLQGRVHLYEGFSPDTFRVFIGTLKLLGCETLLITNSSGSLNEAVTPGNLVLITDQINFQFSSPLVGENDEAFGPRFVSMENAFDVELRQRLLAVAKKLNISLAQGVYLGVLGPAFETPAEIRAFRTLGADVIGMSTVPEVIAARHCGLRVAAIATITNLAAGLSTEKLSHEQTLAGALMGIDRLTQLILSFVENLQHDGQ